MKSIYFILIAFPPQGGKRGLVVWALELSSGGPRFKSSCQQLSDLSSVVPNATPPRFVSSQLDSLPDLGFFVHNMFV